MTSSVKYKVSGKFQNKNVPFILVGGMFLLLIFFFVVGLIGQETAEFDSRVENETERIHQQIIAEKYTDVYLKSGKKLITAFRQQEFEDRLRNARPQLTGKIEKSCTTIYPDMMERLKRNLFMSFQLATICRMENESMRSYHYFDWRIGSSRNEMKLIWFGTEPRK